jgi:hypothetical protein
MVIIPLAKASREVDSILALDELAKVILARKKGRVRLLTVCHVKVE